MVGSIILLLLTCTMWLVILEHLDAKRNPFKIGDEVIFTTQDNFDVIPGMTGVIEYMDDSLPENRKYRITFNDTSDVSWFKASEFVKPEDYVELN